MNAAAWVHSCVLAKFVAMAEEVTSTIDTLLLNSILVESEDPELVPHMQCMAQVAQLLVNMVKASAAHSAATVCDHSSSPSAQASNTLETHSQDAGIRAKGAAHANEWPGWPSMTPNTAMT